MTETNLETAARLSRLPIDAGTIPFRQFAIPSHKRAVPFRQRPIEVLAEQPPLPQCEACVVVPVRNEAETLTATLTALAHQVNLQGAPIDRSRYEVILLANNCDDDSAAIARKFVRQHPSLVLHVVERTLPPAEAYIGHVRQLLMDEAYRRFSLLDRADGIIASTDGDSRVAPDWIAATQFEIQQGADAVGGRIVTDRRDRAALPPYARACHLREVGYRYLISELESQLDADPHDRWPRHYQHYGASLAVTAAMYAQAGGMPAVRTAEDVAFYRSLLRVNARFRHSPFVCVTTSARQTGRTNLGLANQLHEWTRMGEQGEPFLVESAAAIETRFRSRRILRQQWWHWHEVPPRPDLLAALAETLGVNADWLQHELKQQSFGVLFERVEQQQAQEGHWRDRWPLVRIEQAIADLRLTLARMRSRSICPDQEMPAIDRLSAKFD